MLSHSVCCRSRDVKYGCLINYFTWVNEFFVGWKEQAVSKLPHRARKRFVSDLSQSWEITTQLLKLLFPPYGAPSHLHCYFSHDCNFTQGARLLWAVCSKEIILAKILSLKKNPWFLDFLMYFFKFLFLFWSGQNCRN